MITYTHKPTHTQAVIVCQKQADIDSLYQHMKVTEEKLRIANQLLEAEQKIVRDLKANTFKRG